MSRIEDEPLDGPDYCDYEYEEETSQFDPDGRWSPGCDCYFVQVRVRIPKSLGDDNDRIEEWLYNNSGRLKYI